MPMISDFDHGDKHIEQVAWAIAWRVVLLGTIATNLVSAIIGFVPSFLWGFYQASSGIPIEQITSLFLLGGCGL